MDAQPTEAVERHYTRTGRHAAKTEWVCPHAYCTWHRLDTDWGYIDRHLATCDKRPANWVVPPGAKKHPGYHAARGQVDNFLQYKIMCNFEGFNIEPNWRGKEPTVMHVFDF